MICGGSTAQPLRGISQNLRSFVGPVYTGAMSLTKNILRTAFLSAVALGYAAQAGEKAAAFYELGYSYGHGGLRIDPRSVAEKCTTGERAKATLRGAYDGTWIVGLPVYLWGTNQSGDTLIGATFDSLIYAATAPFSAMGRARGVYKAYGEYCANPNARDPSVPQYYLAPRRPAPVAPTVRS